MTYPYRSFQIADIVKAAKVVREGQALKFRNHGERGKSLDLDLDLKDGSLPGLRWRVTAGRFDEPATYEAALVLADQRIRGIGYSETARRYFHKVRIPQGWHENAVDPNLATSDVNRNRHTSLPNFAPTDLQDFLRRVGEKWHIKFVEREALL